MKLTLRRRRALVVLGIAALVGGSAFVGWQGRGWTSPVVEGTAVVTNVNGDDTGVFCMTSSSELPAGDSGFTCGRGFMTGGGSIDQTLVGSRVRVERLDGILRDGNQAYLLYPSE